MGDCVQARLLCAKASGGAVETAASDAHGAAAGFVDPDAAGAFAGEAQGAIPSDPAGAVRGRRGHDEHGGQDAEQQVGEQ